MKIKWIVCILLLTSCLSCGYHFSPGGENIDAAVQKVFIGNFSNSTSEANVENYIRNAFFTRFRSGTRFSLVAGKGKADAVLTGKIKSITSSHLAYSSSDMARENRVWMTVEVVFKRTDNGGVIWMNKGLSGREAYTVDVNTTTTAANRKTAISKLSIDMADKAYRNMMSGF